MKKVSAVALLGVLLLGPGMGGAATVDTVGVSDQIATGISDLEFNGTTYNVAFLKITGEDLYGTLPRTYDFDNEADASGALDAVIGALNDNGGIEEVGNLLDSLDSFTIGFATGVNPGNIQTVTGGGVVFGWSNDGIRILDKDVLNIYADFQVVPVPAAVWLFGSGLLGLIGVARHRKAT